MPKPVKLSVIRNERRRAEARGVRADLFSAARRASGFFGDDVAGFALVVWDRDGAIATSFATPYGPVCKRLVPTVAFGALTEGVAVDAAGTAFYLPPDDEGA